MKKTLVAILAVSTLLLTSVSAFATEPATGHSVPAKIVAGLTDRTVGSVIAEHVQTGETYGTIAKNAGVLDEFKAGILEVKKDALAKQVANGTLTQAEADAIIAEIEANQEICDGTGADKIGCGKDSGCGSKDVGRGNGKGQGRGRGVGGMKLQDGSCYDAK